MMAHTSPIWKIEGGHQLSGSCTVSGSKNASLATICAAILDIGPVVLNNIPRISDVFDMVSILRSAGTSVAWLDNNTLEIQRPPLLTVDNLDIEASRRTRAVVLLVAALAKDHDGPFIVPLPGGCTLGDRSLGPHIDALEQLGLHVNHDLGESDKHLRDPVRLGGQIREASKDVRRQVACSLPLTIGSFAAAIRSLSNVSCQVSPIVLSANC